MTKESIAKLGNRLLPKLYAAPRVDNSKGRCGRADFGYKPFRCRMNEQKFLRKVYKVP